MRWLVIVLLSTLFVAGVAHAQDDPVAAFERAVELYREGRYQDSIDILTKLRETHPEPVLHYNLSLAYEGLGEYEKAAIALERYLAADLEISNRDALVERLAKIEARLDALEREREQEAARVREAERVQYVEAATEQRDPWRVAAPWIVTGVGVTGVAIGLALGAVAQGRRSDAVEDPVQQSSVESLRAAESMATAANVTIIAGSIVAAVGLTWVIVDAASGDPDVQATLGPGSVSVRVSF